MRNKFYLGAAVLIVSMIACNQQSDGGSKDKGDAVLVKRGEYLVAIAGCDDCHSPKRMGAKGPEIIPELRLSGYPSSRPVQEADTTVLRQGWTLMNADLTVAAGTWGMSFSANITSDETGIGNWTEEQFRKALTQGKWKGMDNGRTLMPPMPWQNYSHFSDEDVKAIYLYLKTTAPVKNVDVPGRPYSAL